MYLKKQWLKVSKYNEREKFRNVRSENLKRINAKKHSQIVIREGERKSLKHLQKNYTLYTM